MKVKSIIKDAILNKNKNDSATVKRESVNFSNDLWDIFQSNNLSEGDGRWLIDRIFIRIAEDLSLMTFKDVIRRTEEKIYYELNSSAITFAFTTRFNNLQTASEGLSTLFYQLLKYGNAIAIPNFKNGVLQEIEVLDISQCSFGHGYLEKGNKDYLIINKIPDNEITALDYSKIIHLRREPWKVFENDKYPHEWDITQLPKLFNQNITKMLQEMSENNVVRGVLKLSGSLNSNQSKEILASDFKKQIKAGAPIIVTDLGDEFVPLKKEYSPVAAENINELLKHLYATYGINQKIIDGNYTFAEYSSYYNTTLEPIINRFVQEVNYKLYSEQERRMGRQLIVDKRHVVGVELGSLTEHIDKMVYMGIYTPNEGREMLGLPPRPEGDILMTNLNATPLEQSGAEVKRFKNLPFEEQVELNHILKEVKR